MKRVAILAGFGILAVVLVAVSVWIYLGRGGSSDLENWIGRQIVAVLNHHVTPRVEFENLDYQAPRTVVLDNLTFTAGDQRILRIVRAKLELAEIPRYGQPIKIERVELTSPQIQLIADGNEGLLGWNNFVRRQAVQHPESVPAGERLSDVLVLRHITIQDGELVYQTGPGENDRMTLPNINLQLDTPPDAKDPGAHQLVGRLKRDPLFDIHINGKLDLDTATLDLARLEISASLGEQQYATLPPRLQSFLRQNEVRGVLTASAQGRIPLKDPAKLAGTFRVDLRDGRFRYHDTVLPVRQVHVNATLPNGAIDVRLTGLGLSVSDQPLLAVDRVLVRVAGIPATGAPLRIEKIEVDKPRVTLASRPQGGFVGWSDLAGSSPRRSPQPPTDIAHVLRSVQLQRLDVHDGTLSYRPVQAPEPIAVDAINVALSTSPDPTSPEVLSIVGHLQAASVFDADLRARLDGRSAVLDLEQFKANATISRNGFYKLPSIAGDALSGLQLRGDLTVTGNGHIPIRKPEEASGRIDVTARNVQLAYGDTLWPVQELQLNCKTSDRAADARYDAKLLGGAIKGDLRVPLSREQAFALTWQVAGVRLEEIMRAAGQKSDYAGLVASQGRAQGQLANLPASLSGSGSIAVTRARLVELPVIRAVLSAIAVLKTRLSLPLPDKDEGEMAWDFRPDHLQVNRVVVNSSLASLHGKGQLYYDGRVNIDVTAEPRLDELPVQVLGKIGAIIQGVEDLGSKLVTFNVRGTFSNPTVVPLPAGLGSK